MIDGGALIHRLKCAKELLNIITAIECVRYVSSWYYGGGCYIVFDGYRIMQGPCCVFID